MPYLGTLNKGMFIPRGSGADASDRYSGVLVEWFNSLTNYLESGKNCE